MNAEIQNMIGVLIHVAKSDEFLDHEEKKVLKNIIYRYSVDSEDLKKIKSTQENLSEKLLKVKTPENKELVVKLSALIIASDGMITDVEKTTFKNIRNFLGEKEYKYKDIMSEGELDRDKILEQELKIMNLLPPIESIN
jgi:tellurite resistance protein|tara:strand:+ start:101 stop:517 length:417 start_codon:yes stop_codon:yes gene_type:complete